MAAGRLTLRFRRYRLEEAHRPQAYVGEALCALFGKSVEYLCGLRKSASTLLGEDKFAVGDDIELASSALEGLGPMPAID